MPAAILFVGVLLTVQSAADAAVAAAQVAGPGPQECDGDEDTDETAQECEGLMGARLAMAASGSWGVAPTRGPGWP